MKLPVYLDFAASTPVAPEVVDAMLVALRSPELVGNPAAGTHVSGQLAAAAVEAARAEVAALIHADPEEIVFTSGATEADNLAIIGGARFRQAEGRHVVTMLTEHKAVLESCRYLAREGWRITWLKPDADGVIAPSAVEAALESDTVLVSVMHANNETGVVQDVAAIGHLCRERRVLLHVDAAQSAGRLPVDVRALQIDLLSLSAHKIYGPKGIGALFIDRERLRRVEPLLFGGGQERGLRPGTLPTHQIVGMGVAFRIAGSRLSADRRHVTGLRDRLWARLQLIPGVIRNGHPEQNTGHILNVSVEGVEGESLHAGLGELAVASGSACTSRTDEPSYVLRVLGRSAALARSSVRFSFGRPTTEGDIDRAAEVFARAVADLRARSPAGISDARAADSGACEVPGTVLACGEAGSMEAGTWVTMTAAIRDGRVDRLDARVYGCPHTLAACDRAVQLLTGGTATGLGSLDPLALGAELEIPVEKTGRLLIIQDALRNCLADWDNGRLDQRRCPWPSP
ncbi:MAG: aminotransferase class V-fold PLP-dependent enzyme [Gammaproteobacteria bacterium]|nr:aminotransferase class V-fold PLP-dependent enzyme [Gammaproteobacteria bacterium]